MSELNFEIHTVPVLDTGIGIEAGYESDAAFLAAMEAERAALPPEIRAAMDLVDAAIERSMLGLNP